MISCLGQAKIMFEFHKISDNLLRLTEKVEGLTHQISQKIDGITQPIAEKIDGLNENLSEKVESITEHLNQLTELVQSTPNPHPSPAPTPAATNGSVVGVGRGWTCSPELRVCSISTIALNPRPNQMFYQAVISSQANRLITIPRLESYTRLESPDRQWLAHSLFNRIKVKFCFLSFSLTSTFAYLCMLISRL